MDFQSGRRRKNSFSDEDDVREPIKVSRMWMNEAADLDGLQANTFKPVMADHHMRLQPRVDNATPSALSLQQRAMAAIALQEIRSFDPAKHIFPQRQHPQLLAQQPNSGMKYPQQQHMAPSLIPQGPLLDRYGGSAAPQNSVPALGDPPSPKIGANMSPQSIYPMQGMPIARQQPNGLLMVDPSQSVNGKQPSRSWYSTPMVEPPMMAPMRPPMGNMFPPDFQDMENRGAVLQYQTTHDQQQQIQHEPGTSAESNAALNGYQGSSSAQVGVNFPKASTSNSCLGRISSEQYQGLDRRVISYASPPENGQAKSAVEAGTEDAQVQQGSAVQIKQSSNRTYTKVYKLGSIGRAVDVARFKTYSELRAELARMFGLEGQLDQKSGWQLVFVDKENDLLLVGDDPWEEFVNSVRGIRILSPSEVSFYTSDERSEAL